MSFRIKKIKGKTPITTPDLSSFLQSYPQTLKSVNLGSPSFNFFFLQCQPFRPNSTLNQTVDK
jgi:hypothetical protein